MRRPVIQILLFFALIFSQALSSAQDVNFTVVKSAPEITGSQILDMTQDAQGFLWFSTQHGLFKYDGDTYISYHHELENSPAQEAIECLTADSTYIWSAPQWLGLDRLDPISGSFHHFRHDRNNPGSLANDSVMALLTDRNGTLWIGTYQGLDRLDKGSTTFIHYRHDSNDPSSLSFNAVRSLYEDKQGTIWVGTGSVFNQGDPRFKKAGGLNRLNKATGKFTRYLHDDIDSFTLIDNRIRAIFEDSRGTFWVGTAGDGLHTLDRETGVFMRHRFDPSHPGKLSRPPIKSSLPWGEDHISFIAEAHDGKIVIGTFSAGVHVYDPVTQKTAWYGTDKKCHEKLDDELFWTAYKTTDNTLWISSWGGSLYKVASAPNPISYTRTNRITIALIEDDRQNLWTGTANGLFCKDKNGNEERYLIDPDHPASPANLAFPIDKDQDKLLIQTSFGLYFFDVVSKQFSRFLHNDPRNENSLPSDTIPRIRKTAEGNWWIATYRGLASWNAKSGLIKRYLNDPHDSTTLINDQIAWIEIDSKKNLWVGTTGGLCRIEKGTSRFKRYPNIPGVLYILEDSKGNLWVGGQDGLFQYDAHHDTFHKFKDRFFIMPAQVQVGWMMEDAHENIWLGTSAGIIELRSDDNLRPVALGKNFGIKPFALTSGYIRHNGTVLFADTSGYFEISPALLRESNHSIAITNLLFDNEPVMPGTTGILPDVLARTKEIKLAYDQNTFAFEFTSIDFSNEQSPPHLFYRLENYDETWRKAGSEKMAYYFSISPGNYVFEIMAVDAKGNTVEKSIAVIIARPWWKTWWAYSLLAITMGSVGYVIYHSRVRQLKKQQAAQISVMVATQEQERKRISRDLHDDVGTKLSALKMFVSSLREKAAMANEKELASLAASSEQFIQEVISDVRSLLLNLSPSVLEEFGFVTAVEVLFSKLNETGHVYFTLAVFEMDRRVQQDYELALYRITQELIHNVLKHAEAKHVSLQVGRRNGKIILMIEDDGKGFEMNTRRGGYGLQNIAARAELMQGLMTVDSKPGKGTSVSIEIPYEVGPL
jgi:signal transduction histidine kinase/ligand-binding sensor domain-containing protein